MQAMSTSMIEYAYRNVNKIPRDSTLTDYVKQVPTFEYYDFIPQYISNSPMELYGSSYASLLDVLRYTNFSGAERIIKDNQVPDNTAEVTKVMGTDKGILFDLLDGRRLAGSIKEFKPLSNEELRLVDKTAPDIRVTLLDMNDNVWVLCLQMGWIPTGIVSGSHFFRSLLLFFLLHFLQTEIILH